MEKKKTTKKSTVKKPSTKTKSKIVVEKKKGFNSVETVIIAFITLVVGLILGLAISLGAGKYSNKSKLKSVEEAFNKLLNNEYTNLTEEDLNDAAIRGMMTLTDENSSYIKDSEYLEGINGYYNGIGISICRSEDGLIYVCEVNETGPSKDILMVGDQVLSFNEYSYNETDLIESSKFIKALPIDTIVKVRVNREDNELEFNIPIKVVTIKTVSSYNIDKEVGYLKLDYISTNTYSQVKEAIDYFNNYNINKLILDLRCNSGGDVNALRNIASIFLNNNSIIYKESINNEVKDVLSSGEPIYKGKLVVLVDGGTASSAEILASTLKDNVNAKIIGTNTFGKYTIQTTYTLSNGNMIKYSVGEWLRKDGSSIKNGGIIPDKFVTNDAADNQYNEGIKELKKD